MDNELSNATHLSTVPGGLVVYKLLAPVGWEFSDFNNRANSEKMNKMLEESNFSNVTVKYKMNRAVIFDSSLLHRTDNFKFRKDYKARRINMTLLFGKKADVPPKS